MLIDFHVHSTHTEDSPNSIPEIVSAVAASGLDGFCLTDINTMAGIDEAKEAASGSGLVALVGMEALTDKGHFLVFFPEPRKLPDIPKLLEIRSDGIIPIQSLLDVVNHYNGVLIAAHPYDRSVKHSSGDGIVQIGSLAGIEVGNARRSSDINHMAEEVAAGLGLVGVAGSDARYDLKQIGSAATLLRGRVETESDMIEKVLSFDVWPVLIGKQPKRTASPRRRQTSAKTRSHQGKRYSGSSRSNDRSRDSRARTPRGQRESRKKKR